MSDSSIGGYDHAKGVGCRINDPCYNAMLLGASEAKQVLDETDLKRANLDLEAPTC